MISAAGFKIFIDVMFWSALGVLGLSMSLMVLLLLARIRAIAQRKHIEALVAVWRRIFTGASKTRREVAARDTFTVLSLWNDFQRVRTDTQGVAREQLDEIARVQQFDPLALRLLRRGDAGDRIVALTYLGYRRLDEALPLARELTSDPQGEVALAAYRTAVLIHPPQLREFVFAISRREDWRLQTVEQILKELGPARVSRTMAIAAEDATAEQALRIIRFFTLCDPSIARAAVRDQLAFREDSEVLASALRILGPVALPQDRELIHRFLEHPVAFVRIAAIGAIVPVCDGDDRDRIMRLLSDENSWVRYRAAQTLLDCFTNDERAGDLRKEVADRYAKDALTQVLAERSVLDLRQFVAEEVEPEPDPSARRGPQRRPVDAMRAQG